MHSAHDGPGEGSTGCFTRFIPGLAEQGDEVGQCSAPEGISGLVLDPT